MLLSKKVNGKDADPSSHAVTMVSKYLKAFSISNLNKTFHAKIYYPQDIVLMYIWDEIFANNWLFSLFRKYFENNVKENNKKL